MQELFQRLATLHALGNLECGLGSLKVWSSIILRELIFYMAVIYFPFFFSTIYVQFS